MSAPPGRGPVGGAWERPVRERRRRRAGARLPDRDDRQGQCSMPSGNRTPVEGASPPVISRHIPSSPVMSRHEMARQGGGEGGETGARRAPLRGG